MITITIATHKLNLPYIRLGFENRMIKQSTNMKKWPQNAGHLDNPAIQINAFGNPPKMIHQGLGTHRKVNQVQQSPQRLLKVPEGRNLNDSAPQIFIQALQNGVQRIEI